MIVNEGRPIEWLQWFCLAASVITAGYLWGCLAASGKKYAIAYGVLAVGIAVMLIEDAGNIRHHAGNFMVVWLVGADATNAIAKNIFELFFYGLLGALLVFPFLRFGLSLAFSARAFKLIVISYVAYGIAAVSSATSYFSHWYAVLGRRVIDLTSVDSAPSWQNLEMVVEDRIWPYSEVGFWLMDYLYEESFELVGAFCLLAGLLALGAEELKLIHADNKTNAART